MSPSPIDVPAVADRLHTSSNQSKEFDKVKKNGTKFSRPDNCILSSKIAGGNGEFEPRYMT